MNWDDLRFFLELSRALKLRATSKRLGVSSTTIGRKISRLEKSLNTTLFERTRSGVQLTENGRRLLTYAEAIERQASSASIDMAGTGAEPQGVVRVSMPEGFGTWVIVPMVRDFVEAHPTIRLDIVSSGDFLSPSKREADIALMLDCPKGGNVTVQKLLDYSLYFYASEQFISELGAPRAIEDLSRFPVISYIPDLVPVPQQKLLEEVLPDSKPRLRCSSINAQAFLVKNSAGIGILPRFVGDQMGGLRPVLTDCVRLTRSIWLVVHRDIRPMPRVDLVINWLRNSVHSGREMFSAYPRSAPAKVIKADD
jgi:DNA-binding transcriptional LysR family regulator